MISYKTKRNVTAAMGASLIVLGLVTIGFVPDTGADAAPLRLVNEPLTGTATAAGAWTVGGSTCLTSAGQNSGDIPQCVPEDSPLDVENSGALQFTSLGEGDSGFAFNNTPIDTGRGLQISFDQYQWSGTGGDGLSFFLMDGSDAAVAPGADGGALGYADAGTRMRDIVVGVNGEILYDVDGRPIIAPWDPGAPILTNYQAGVSGAFAGVAFDTVGNFSSEDVGPIDHLGPGNRPNSVVIRGSEASHYGYIAGAIVSQSLAVRTASDRTSARIHVDIFISTQSVMSVLLTYPDGRSFTALNDIDLRTINGTQPIPSTLKFGFSAGTGVAFQYNEINNVIVTTLAPDLSLRGSVGVGPTDTDRLLTYLLSNLDSAGSTDGLITFSGSLPGGATGAASGDGWSCDIASHVVTCSRPADGSAAVGAGTALPPIRLTLSGVTARRAQLVMPASVALADDGDLTNNVASVVLAEADPSTDDPSNDDPADSDDPTSSIPSGSGGSGTASSGVGSAALRSSLASTGSADAATFTVLADVFILTGIVLVVIAFRRSLRRSRHRL